MYNYNHNRYTQHMGLSRIFLVSGFLAAMMLTAINGSTMAATNKPAQAGKLTEASILSKCRADLAKRLKLKAKDIKLANAETITWPNAALGMPEINKTYASAKTPGSKLFLEAGNRIYLYTTSAKMFKYGGPTSIWAYSMLYLQPVKNDPNLNSELYQCSLIGTNGIRLASEVSDYYPQTNGAVVIKRRTSRSGHDLLYIKADEPGKEKMLYRGMDFGDTALDVAHNRWAGFVKPRLGAAWAIVTGQLDEGSLITRSISLPDEVWPGKIAWSLDNIMILGKNKDHMVAFETNPTAEPVVWKPASTMNFPGQDAFVLNKSETLVIEQVKEGNKSAVEVARIWFTGDRNVVASIPDFTMQGYDLLGPYAFIWGGKETRHTAYSVDISSGVTLKSVVGTGINIKPFNWSPHDSPVPKQPRID